MIKSVICIVAAVFLLVINTCILFLKPDFSFAENDDEDYTVYYQKWISTAVFMSSIIIALLSIYFAIDYYHHVAYILLTLECVLVVAYALCRYKGITVFDKNIRVERLFRKDLKITFEDIINVTYVPNAKLVVRLKKKQNFDVSFNSENFYKFYRSLIKRDVKFKTGRIPKDEDHVVITKYNITLHLPKATFREYYQSEAYLRNSTYLFSARSLEYGEYVEGYTKESGKDLKEFISLIKNDLGLNNFKPKTVASVNIDGFDFSIVKCVNKDNPERGRNAYIYKEDDNYFVMYADYYLKNQAVFEDRMKQALKKTVYEDTKSRIAKV